MPRAGTAAGRRIGRTNEGRLTGRARCQGRSQIGLGQPEVAGCLDRCGDTCDLVARIREELEDAEPLDAYAVSNDDDATLP